MQETRQKDLKNNVENVRKKRSVLRQKLPPSMKNWGTYTTKKITRGKKSLIPFKKHMISKLPSSEMVKEQQSKVSSETLSGEQEVVSESVADDLNKTASEKIAFI